MRAFVYLTKRTLINNLKQALHKPATLLLLIFLTGYGIFLAVSLGTLAINTRFNSVQGLVVVVTLWTLYIFMGDFLAYASRKGVIFRPGHTHFVFPAPISPKVVLLQSAWMNYITSVAASLLFVIAGIVVFGVAPWKMLLFFVVGGVLENIFECSLMVWMYTNERVPEKLMKVLGWIIKGVLAAISLVIILYFRREGITLESATAFFDWPVLQMIPLVGWNIALYRLILLGPSLLNVVCSVLYLSSVLLMSVAAIRMKCDGGYYEEAAKFADDYAEMRQRKKSGEMVLGIGKEKRSFRKVENAYEGSGARVIFSRQLLEYRKEKYFIFSKMTLMCMILAGIMVFSMTEGVRDTTVPQFFMLGVIAYVSLLMSGYTGKWEKELANPYTFLIPDKAGRKLWYATLMEHVKALLDGIIMCVPIGLYWGVAPVYVIQTILIYVVLQANRLYMRVLAQCLVGNYLGKTGQSLVRMLIQMFVQGFGILFAVLVGMLINPALVFPIVLLYTLVVAVLAGLIASIRFDTMEQL